jgi:hypothetical protein
MIPSSVIPSVLRRAALLTAVSATVAGPGLAEDGAPSSQETSVPITVFVYTDYV